MSRNPDIEAIHEARYHLQTFAVKERSAARQQLQALLEQAAAKANPPVQPRDVELRGREIHSLLGRRQGSNFQP